MSRRRTAVRRAAAVAPFVAIVLMKLWLVGGQRLTAYGSLTIDDRWFVARAASIADGDWLGPFDAYTLVKRPGYPMFVAAAHAAHVPLLLAQQLAFAVACTAAVTVLRRVLPGRRAPLAFALLVFDPATMNASVSARVDRSLLYGALLVALTACLVALVDAAPRDGSGFGRFARWAGATSAVLAVIWLVREEFPLVVPALAAALVAVAAVVVRSGGSMRRRGVALLALVAVPMSVPLASASVRAANEHRYGLAIDNLQQQSEAYALGPMFRVEPVTEFSGFPVTAETRAALYPVSPTFAALRDEIEDGGGRRFATLRPDGVADLNGSVFQWVVLDAVAATGAAPSARAMDDTFRAIGREIDAACDSGRLVCGPPHTGVTAPWRWGDALPVAKRTVYAAWRTALIAPFDATPPAGDAPGADRALFARVTREPLTPGGTGTLTSVRAGAIRAIRLAYVALAAVALAWVAVRAVRSVRWRRRPDPLVLTALVVGSLLVAARLVGLAYLDVTAFQALSPSYLAPAHAVATLVVVVGALARRSAAAGVDVDVSGTPPPDRRCR